MPDAAVILLIAGCLSAGVLGGVIRGWHVISDLKVLERRVTLLEAGLTTEIKRRAGESRPPRAPAGPVLPPPEMVAASSRERQPWEF